MCCLAIASVHNELKRALSLVNCETLEKFINLSVFPYPHI